MFQRTQILMTYQNTVINNWDALPKLKPLKETFLNVVLVCGTAQWCYTILRLASPSIYSRHL